MSDIKEIHGKYYDFGTDNESFLLTAKELKTVGIKNYYFMLRIDNPRVADIDPFKPNITKQEVDALMAEFCSNVWSFCRMAVRLRTDAGIVRFGLHRGLASVIWCFERHFDACLCEPRQTWKTTGIIGGPLQWAFQFSKNLHMQFFGKETENTKRNLATLRDDIALLPEWMQFKRYIGDDGKIKKARQATESLENNLFHNKLIIHPKPTSLSHAQGMARGDSGAILYFDEIEHTPFFPELMSNSAPLFKTASDNARSIGAPFGRIFTCTPGNLDTREGIDSLPIIKSMIPWTEKIYDMSPEDIEEYKSAFREEFHETDIAKTREVVDVFYCEYQYYQVRKTYDWVLEEYRLMGDKQAVRREILLQRIRGSTSSPIDPEDIEYLISHMSPPDHDIIINKKWRFLVYEHGQGHPYGQWRNFNPEITYLVGIDPASGVGGDNFSITITNPRNLKVAAEFESQYISGPAAVQMLVTLVTEYIPKAILIPEKNSMGYYLIQMIVEQTSIKENLYWSESEAEKQLKEIANEDPEMWSIIKDSLQYKKYGTYTTPSVRKAMFNLMFDMITEHRDLMNGRYLVDEMCKLVRTSTGRIEAVKGEHDDSVLSYLHTLFIYFTGDNLRRFGFFKEDWPIASPVEENVAAKLAEKSGMNGIYESEPETYDEYVMRCLGEQEQQIKILTNTFDFVKDSVYKNRDPLMDGESMTVSIPPSFFDEFCN